MRGVTLKRVQRLEVELNYDLMEIVELLVRVIEIRVYRILSYPYSPTHTTPLYGKGVCYNLES